MGSWFGTPCSRHGTSATEWDAEAIFLARFNLYTRGLDDLRQQLFEERVYGLLKKLPRVGYNNSYYGAVVDSGEHVFLGAPCSMSVEVVSSDARWQECVASGRSPIIIVPVGGDVDAVRRKVDEALRPVWQKKFGSEEPPLCTLEQYMKFTLVVLDSDTVMTQIASHLFHSELYIKGPQCQACKSYFEARKKNLRYAPAWLVAQVDSFRGTSQASSASTGTTRLRGVRSL